MKKEKGKQRGRRNNDLYQVSCFLSTRLRYVAKYEVKLIDKRYLSRLMSGYEMSTDCRFFHTGSGICPSIHRSRAGEIKSNQIKSNQILDFGRSYNCIHQIHIRNERNKVSNPRQVKQSMIPMQWCCASHDLKTRILYWM